METRSLARRCHYIACVGWFDGVDRLQIIFGAILLILYYLPVTLIVHSFWNDPVKVQRIQAIMFMKNIAIMGGLLMIIVNGSGRYSIKRLLATLKV